MTITLEPPISEWRVEPRGAAGRDELMAAVNGCAEALGTGRITQTTKLIGTGHQAWFWHPGILAKDLALSRAAAKFGAETFHLVVDQDVNDAMKLELPVRRGDRLEIETLQLVTHRPAAPTGWQPPVDASVVIGNLRAARDRLGATLQVDLSSLIQAFTDPPACRTLAEQITVALTRLRQPYAGNLPVLFVSDLAKFGAFREIVERMLHDARRCVENYNRAVAHVPAAGMTAMAVEQDRVELPLWVARWEKPRERVFADFSDSKPLLTLEDGKPIDSLHDVLQPRALSLTATLRRSCCELFIHGKGGGIYDRITETWWRNWAGEELAPIAVASADLRLDFTAPVAVPEQVTRATWLARYVKSNIDRLLKLPGSAEVARKRELLAHMKDDRDRNRKAAAFREIHHINTELAQAFPAKIAEAQEQLARARVGVANQAVARKRDWCFALYPAGKLEGVARLFD